MERRQRQRAIWAGAGVGAAVVHLFLLIVLQPDRELDAPLPEPQRAIHVTLGPPFPPRPESDDEAPRRTATREAVAPYPDPASLPSVRSLGPPQPAPSPSRGLPATPGSTNSPGVNWSLTDPPDSALRRVLRRSVGCDYGLKLTKAEQDACDERFGRNRLKEPAPVRLAADKRRARELEAQADHAMKLHEYKRQPPPEGTFNDLREMGGQPPRPGQ